MKDAAALPSLLIQGVPTGKSEVPWVLPSSPLCTMQQTQVCQEDPDLGTQANTTQSTSTEGTALTWVKGI